MLVTMDQVLRLYVNKKPKKQKPMKLLFAICSMLLMTNTATSINVISNLNKANLKCNELNSEECELRNKFLSIEDAEPVKIDDIFVYNIDEEVTLNFDTKEYLPKDFNALKGLGDLNWDNIKLVELDEKVNLGFYTKKYLPKDFNALKGLGDLNWDNIKLVELDEEVNLGFDTKKYLPKDFNPYEGMPCKMII